LGIFKVTYKSNGPTTRTCFGLTGGARSAAPVGAIEIELAGGTRLRITGRSMATVAGDEGASVMIDCVSGGRPGVAGDGPHRHEAGLLMA
jgi:hypothetical protein